MTKEELIRLGREADRKAQPGTLSWDMEFAALVSAATGRQRDEAVAQLEKIVKRDGHRGQVLLDVDEIIEIRAAIASVKGGVQ